MPHYLVNHPLLAKQMAHEQPTGLPLGLHAELNYTYLIDLLEAVLNLC